MKKFSTFISVVLLVAACAIYGYCSVEITSHATPLLVAQINTALINATSADFTNGSTLTVAAGKYVLNGVGGTNNAPNTMALSNPSYAGQELKIVMAVGTTNTLVITDGGNVLASGNVTLDDGDTAHFMARNTTNWCLMSESDN